MASNKLQWIAGETPTKTMRSWNMPFASRIGGIYQRNVMGPNAIKLFVTNNSL